MLYPDLAGRQILLLGCGYTASRVARGLLNRGAEIIATTRNPTSLVEIAQLGAKVYQLDLDQPETLVQLTTQLSKDVLVLHSVPLLRTVNGLIDPTPRLLEALADLPARVVYLSTTGVYGSHQLVDETTPVAPRTEREILRVEAERQVTAGNWSYLILRPAGIYGPGRGVHESLKAGKYRLGGDGSNFLSRIHVSDLAVHCEAALLSSNVTGAYPVGDELPARAREIAAFCANLLGLPMPPSTPTEQLPETLQANRQVDGKAIRKELRISLRYPSYREGIPASLIPEFET